MNKGMYKQFVYQDPLSRPSDKEVRKRHSLKCCIHEADDQEIILVCTNSNCALNRFLCAMCVPQHELCGSSLIVLSKIEKEDVSILDPKISKEAKEVLRYYADEKKLMDDVDSFFDELKHRILKEVEQSRRDARVFVEKLLKERGGALRELIDIISSSFNYNSYRYLLKDLEEGRITQEDASRRLTLYIQSKERSAKLKQVTNLLNNGSVPVRHLNIDAFTSEFKKIEQAIHSIKYGLISFKDQPPLPDPKKSPATQKPIQNKLELIDPFLHELPQLIKGRKTIHIKGKRFGLQTVALAFDIEFPRDGYFLQRVKKSTFFSFESMAELLGEGLVASQAQNVVLEVEDKWLGFKELLQLLDLLSQKRFTSMEIKVRSERVRELKRKLLQSKAGPIKLTFL